MERIRVCSRASRRSTSWSWTTSRSDRSPSDARRDLLEILEDRYGLRATIITSQLKHERWHDFLADPTVADAICDRVLHGAHKIALAGPSRRRPKEVSAIKD
jgi:DNA replication protein DnaC